MTDETKDKILKMICSGQEELSSLGITTLVGCRIKRLISKSEFKGILKLVGPKKKLLIKYKLNHYES